MKLNKQDKKVKELIDEIIRDKKSFGDVSSDDFIEMSESILAEHLEKDCSMKSVTRKDYQSIVAGLSLAVKLIEMGQIAMEEGEVDRTEPKLYIAVMWGIALKKAIELEKKLAEIE